MAVTITRTPWIDDDGTGTTGTVINNAVKTALYDDIDAALAKVAQLAGGNTFTGAQGVTGNVVVTGNVNVTISAGTQALLNIRNPVPGTGNNAELSLGNDVQPRALILQAYASNYASSGIFQANGTLLMTQGAGGLTMGPFDSAPLRLVTNGTERLRIAATGDLLLGAATFPPSPVVFGLTSDATVKVPIGIQNFGASGALVGFFNNAGTLIGQISHATATTVAYVTTSDARLKDDAGRATDVAALRAVVVHDFAWKADGRTDRGVFAQDAHAVFPRAIAVGTDETTNTGELARPWMTDYSKFVPDLIVGWQQHDADLAEIRALLTTLKGFSDAE